MTTWLQYGLYLLIPGILAIPVGSYISKIIDGHNNLFSKVLLPCDKFLCKFLPLDRAQMNWKKYFLNVIAFSCSGFLVLFLILKYQNYLPMNTEHLPGLSWVLAFNTAISFVTNTNWQNYSGEMALSNFSQIAGLTVQNFLSAAVGLAVLFALIRGIKNKESKTIGNFWQDLTHIMLYLLLPLSLITSISLVACGVPQTVSGSKQEKLIQPVAVKKDGAIVMDAKIDEKNNSASLDGKKLTNVKIVEYEEVPLYAQASQVAIKQLGTNGGGVLGANSAHPLENPTPVSNLIEITAMLLIPMSVCFAFGDYLGRKKEGIVLFVAMALMFIVCLSISNWAEQQGIVIAHSGNLNMEGKETRLGIPSSVIFSVGATATGTGAVNAMLDSFSSLGGLIPMLLMQIGEVVFGGIGSGLYGMLAFVILTVFIASLMVGRTPEYLGKKIGPQEMKMAVLACLATPLSILIGSGITALIPSTTTRLTNFGAHGFSEFLYAFSSAGANNGSAFSGFLGNTTILNIALALVMILSRFLPIFAILSIAGSMAKQKVTPMTAGTLTTSNTLFVILLIIVIFIIGVLSFFPALALGPIADFLTSY
jgi:K+-transporting ATPase ATPase A chain